MSSMSKDEYLKKYTSDYKKKRVKVHKGKGTKIVDTEYMPAVPKPSDAAELLLDAPDNRPQVVPNTRSDCWKTLEDCDLSELESKRQLLNKMLEDKQAERHDSTCSESGSESCEDGEVRSRQQKQQRDTPDKIASKGGQDRGEQKAAATTALSPHDPHKPRHKPIRYVSSSPPPSSSSVSSQAEGEIREPGESALGGGEEAVSSCSDVSPVRRRDLPTTPPHDAAQTGAKQSGREGAAIATLVTHTNHHGREYRHHHPPPFDSHEHRPYHHHHHHQHQQHHERRDYSRNSRNGSREPHVRGRRLEKEQNERQMEERARKYEVWSHGVKQHEMRRARRDQFEHERAKPLARYADDTDLEAELRLRARQGDPMAAYVRRKQQQASGRSHRPVYSGPEAPPNRYGIQPGYRWDGIDRSNGFERRYFEYAANRNARNCEAYKWSVEDM